MARRQSTLSVCCATGDPPARVAAILAPLRAVADEIVVAVDSRLPQSELGPLRGIADRLFRFEFADYIERTLAWLHAQCTGEWIFRIDGDEVASPELVSGLRGFISEPEIRQVYVPTRWSYPTTSRWLDEFPWFPDYHNRLVRNDASLWFTGLCHSGAVEALPARYVEAPIYHLSCALVDERERERKVARYLGLPAGSKAPGSDRLLATYYLPERHATLPPAPTPPQDRAAIDAVLAAEHAGAASRSRPSRGALHLASRAEIDRHWAERELPESAYRARLAPVERRRELTMRPHERRLLPVRVTNLGTETWPGFLDRRPLIRVACRWERNGAAPVEDSSRTTFAAPLPPGETAIVPALVEAPGEPGAYVLKLDLVHEYVRWFDTPTTVPAVVASGSAAPAARR